jgi:hypothetical protein
MLFTRGIGDSLLDLLLKYDTRNIENNEGENKDRYGGSGSRQLNLLRNVRDDLARRWRLKAIIPTRSNVTVRIVSILCNYLCYSLITII